MIVRPVPLPTPLPLFYTGPDLEEGPLPAIVYLALSAKESLEVDPFDRPATFLAKNGVRVFSLDLPFHGDAHNSKTALEDWARAFAREENILEHFFLKLQESLERILEAGIVTGSKFGIMGLSRGGFLAWHMAARMPEIDHILAFAPLTSLQKGKDFAFLALSPLLESLNLQHLIQALHHKHHKIYIGNRDTRVDTDSCYAWVRSLTESAYENRIRSPYIELVLRPSIGHQGHGTSQESFDEGALWLLNRLTK